MSLDCEFPVFSGCKDLFKEKETACHGGVL